MSFDRLSYFNEQMLNRMNLNIPITANTIPVYLKDNKDNIVAPNRQYIDPKNSLFLRLSIIYRTLCNFTVHRNCELLFIHRS